MHHTLPVLSVLNNDDPFGALGTEGVVAFYGLSVRLRVVRMVERTTTVPTPARATKSTASKASCPDPPRSPLCCGAEPELGRGITDFVWPGSGSVVGTATESTGVTMMEWWAARVGTTSNDEDVAVATVADVAVAENAPRVVADAAVGVTGLVVRPASTTSAAAAHRRVVIPACA